MPRRCVLTNAEIIAVCWFVLQQLLATIVKKQPNSDVNLKVFSISV